MNSRIALLITALLAGCVSKPGTAPQTYDFGIVDGTAPGANVTVMEVRAPEWLDTSEMLYRLAYRDPRALSSYGGSRWAGTPASMLTLRLRRELGSVPGAGCVLTAQIAEFSQVFDTGSASRAVLHVQAVLSSGGSRPTRLQRDFRLESATPTADAAGGAAAFAKLAADLARDAGQWIGESGLCNS